MRRTRGDENEGGARGGESASPKGGRAGQREEKAELAHVGTALRTPRSSLNKSQRRGVRLQDTGTTSTRLSALAPPPRSESLFSRALEASAMMM